MRNFDILIGKIIRNITQSDDSVTFSTSDGMHHVFKCSELFNEYSRFGFGSNFREIIGQEITKIEYEDHGYKIYGSKKDYWHNSNEWVSFWAYGIKEISDVEFSPNGLEMRIKVLSFNDYYNYPVYYYSGGVWHLSTFGSEIREGLQGMEESIF
jgi:hypothetical protein